MPLTDHQRLHVQGILDDALSDGVQTVGENKRRERKAQRLLDELDDWPDVRLDPWMIHEFVEEAKTVDEILRIR